MEFGEVARATVYVAKATGNLSFLPREYLKKTIETAHNFALPIAKQLQLRMTKVVRKATGSEKYDGQLF